jgi:SAM-dependent methyltransferase
MVSGRMDSDPKKYAKLLPGWAGVARESAKVIVPLIIDLLHPKSVADVGCGLGAWLAEFYLAGITDIQGLDGQWVEEEQLLIPRDRFRRVDLSQPFMLERRFDVVVSLEVAEHLPQDAAAGFVKSLAQLGDAHVFSAAIPHQGGTGHVNEQWPGYWVNLFAVHGLAALDPIRLPVWEEERVAWWYAQNVLVFATEERIAANKSLAASRSARASLPLVHPQNYLAKQALSDRSIARIVLSRVARKLKRR